MQKLWEFKRESNLTIKQLPQFFLERRWLFEGRIQSNEQNDFCDIIHIEKKKLLNRETKTTIQKNEEKMCVSGFSNQRRTKKTSWDFSITKSTLLDFVCFLFYLRVVACKNEEGWAVWNGHDLVERRLGSHPSGLVCIIFLRFKLTIILVYSTKHFIPKGK
jgi:hypothetical protein